MRPVHHPAPQDLDLATVLYALGDTVRLDIVRRLADAGGEMSCTAASCEGLAKSTLSHHIKVLREAGLIRTRKIGVSAMNTLRKAEIEARFPGLLDAVLRAAPTAPRDRKGRAKTSA